MSAYAVTIFSGAFLLFQVQPIVAKYILPWFGGSSGVWTTCLLFFQVLLVGGYAYAHVSSRWLGPRAQGIVHLGLMAAALASLPITPSDAWKPAGTENPALRILALLAVSLGLPYFTLASTSPLLQHWFSRTYPGRSPYRLYALSNVGSLLALASYPFFFENHLTRKAQATMWGYGLGIYALCCGYCAVKLFKGKWQAQDPKSGQPDGPLKNRGAASDVGLRSSNETARPTGFIRLLWVMLPACSSALLLSITNKMCQDVAVIPFLWVLPLGLYLLSFVICFDSPRWYVRWLFGLALLAAIGWLSWALPKISGNSLRVLLSGYCASFFVGCMVCHGELYRLRPEPRYLTSYYLLIAAGGAVGGVLVALVAPLIFKDYWELQLSFSVTGLLFLLSLVRTQRISVLKVRSSHGSQSPRGGPIEPNPSVAPWLQGRRWPAIGCFSLCLVFVVCLMWVQTIREKQPVIARARSFYGVLKVYELAKNDPAEHHLSLVHGQTMHGLQFVNPPISAAPTLYYGAQSSGVGLAMMSLPERGRRIGLVGLGVGTLAAYCRTNDYLRAYEINLDVMRMATKYFTYAGRCPAPAECVIGDGRLWLEKDPPQRFDLLALDAFNGDSVPVHLLTKEAFALYTRHLNTNGIIAVHISNTYLDLEPVVVNIAQDMNFNYAICEFFPSPDRWWLRANIWVLLSRSQDLLNTPALRAASRPPEPNCNRVRLWTDDFTSLYQVLR